MSLGRAKAHSLESNVAKHLGLAQWDALSSDERISYLKESHARSIAFFGQQAWDKRGISLFLWAGCMMHKDLNAYKGSYTALSEFWEKNGLTPPIPLLNCDKTAHQAQGGKPKVSKVEHGDSKLPLWLEHC